MKQYYIIIEGKQVRYDGRIVLGDNQIFNLFEDKILAAETRWTSSACLKHRPHWMVQTISMIRHVLSAYQQRVWNLISQPLVGLILLIG